MEETHEKVVQLTDPSALRGIAHPLRLALVGLLRQEGPLTATQASVWLGESSQKLTYHLGQLARYGLVEEAGGGRGRERPWRATADLTSWASMPGNPEAAAASEILESVVARLYFDLTLAWIKGKAREAMEWQQAAQFGDRTLYLSSEELGRLGEDLQRCADAYLERTVRPELRPPGSRAVTLIQLAFPTPPRASQP